MLQNRYENSDWLIKSYISQLSTEGSVEGSGDTMEPLSRRALGRHVYLSVFMWFQFLEERWVPLNPGVHPWKEGVDSSY